LTAAGKLAVDANKRFVQEDNNGNLPASPEVDCPVGAGVPLHQRSLGRIFALLKPAERCETS
jgi:hypothetical protein